MRKPPLAGGRERWDGTEVAITGGAGFLGSHLAERLAARGACVRVLDNLSGCHPAAVQALQTTPNVELISVDVLDPVPLASALKGADVVVHLAGLSNPRMCSEDVGRTFDVNVGGLRNVLAVTAAARRLVFLSSAAVYGNPVRLPMDEDHPTNGNDPYALSKLMGELLCKMYRLAGREVVVVRNFNTFGPRQAPTFLIPSIIEQALTHRRVTIRNGEPIRDFLYVADFVDAIVRLMGTPEAADQTVNVGRGQGTRIRDLARGLTRLLDVPLTDEDKPVGGSRELVCDNGRLRRLTGWAPCVGLDEGLRLTVEYS